MTPVEALEQVVHYLDRARDTGFKAKAFVRALDVVRSLPADEVAERAAAGTLTELDGIGSSSATVVTEALAGETTYLDRMEATSRVPITEAGAVYRNALRGDLHLHSRWSDGGATIEAMARTAMALGHEYMVLTDHSPRLTVAHGLSAERLAEQLQVVAELNERFAPFRILTGIEVDILEDGSLDHGPEVLSQLDIVVASVHNKLRMPSAEMTPRMIAAVSSPHVDILGHCTGRMIGKRDPSEFDAEAVFGACVQHHTAVEINCRPERLDPPMALLKMAIELGCWFSIDSDAHSTGQLEWQPLGCDRAAEAGVPLDRVINTLPLPALLRWVAGE
jgi:putative hydrolase